MRQLIASVEGVAAVSLDRRSDILAWNPLGHALLAGHIDASAPSHPAQRPNLQRLLFLDPHTRELYPRWEEEARRAVASLRLVAGRYPDDRQLAELIGELTMNSREFASLWARHPVHNCTTGIKHFHHPLIGDLELAFEALDHPDESGQRVFLYSAEPGSSSHAALRILAAGLDPGQLQARRPGARVADGN
jgi:hypothetical protein